MGGGGIKTEVEKRQKMTPVQIPQEGEEELQTMVL